MREGGAAREFAAEHEMRRSSKEVMSDYLFGDGNPVAIEAKVKQLRDAREGGDAEIGAEVEYLEGTLAHETANLRHAQMMEYASRLAAEELHRPLEQLSEEETWLAMDAFPDRAALEKEEQTALDAYAKASKSHWDVEHLSRKDAMLQAHDLEWRRALREVPGPERDAELARLDARMGEWLDDPLMFGPEEFGKRSEYAYERLVRRWGTDRRLAHAFQISHTLPREDRKFGIDHQFWIGDRLYKLDQKTFSADLYQDEWQEKKLAEASAKAATYGGRLLPLHSSDLRTAYDAEFKGGRRSFGADVFSPLFGATNETIALEPLLLPPEKKSTPSERISKNEIVNFFDVPRLRAMGLLSNEQLADIPSILAMKNAAIEAARKIAKRKGDLENPEVLEKVTRALREGS